MEDEILLTVGEVAIRCRVHTNTVFRWLHSGDLKAQRAGRKWLIPVSALDAFKRVSQPVKTN
jgi:excisionase family DNA binding protein